MIRISAFADEIGPDLKLQMDTCESHGIKCIDVRGIDGVGVSRMTLTQAREYKKRMDDRGFTVPCIGSPIGKIKISDDFDEHIELLRHCCELAKAFGTDNIRIFSFYASDGKEIRDQRSEVMERMDAMVRLAEAAGCILLHENEKEIYGAGPEGVKDIFATIKSDNLKGIFDPANFVEEGFRPYDDCWKEGLDELTDYFHIKDKVSGEPACVPAGQGEGQFDLIFKELAGKGYSGVMTLEPHLQAAEQFAGFTGPDLFASAVNALKKTCDEAGISYA